MRYIRRHWQGEYSLVRAFWVNFVVLNVVVTVALVVPIAFQWIKHPVYQSRWQIFGMGFVMLVVYPWQLVGLVRTSHRVWVDEQKSLGPILVIGVILVSFLNQVQTFKEELPTYREHWVNGFQPDPLANYHIAVLGERNLIHLEGFFGFGMTREIEDLIEELEEPEAIEGIVLDSGGGRLYEGRALAKLIERHQWDTFSAVGCNSACPLAFVAGSNRTLGRGARLGFHQYTNPITGESLSSEDKEYVVDRQHYAERGIDRTAIDRMFEVPPGELWWPTLEELQQSGLAHNIVEVDDILPAEYREQRYQPIRAALSSVGVFEVGARVDPEFYSQLVDAFWKERALSGPEFDIVAVAPRYFDDWAMTVADRANDTDLTALLSEMGNLMASHPRYCPQMIDPVRYGNLDYRAIISQEHWQRLKELFTRVVYNVDSTVAMMEPVAFQEAVELVQANLGDDIRYLDTSTHTDANTAVVCRVYSRFFEEILALPEGQGPAFYRRMRFINTPS
ncbi:hypothetical protein [Saccharospirillum alexandrii]|uniref:COG3904 family protein n=1 Tax=Saccharospirillum alexandrii TaxID=2448477 RepID=UPI003735905B